MSRENGSVIGVDNTPTTNAASGIWSMNAVARAVKASIWPDLFAGTALRLDFNETTTLDSRITFTRATNGTFFNSSGVLSTATSGAARFDHRLEGGVWVNKGLLIEEGRTNISLYSEELSNGAAWSVVRGSVTTNAIAAPDGTTTAEKFKEDSQTGFHGFNHNLSFPSATTSTFYTASGFIKKIDRQYAQVGLQQRNSNVFVGSVAAIIDLNTGLIETTESGGTAPTDVSTSVQDVGNGWYRVSVTGKTAASGINQVNVTLSPSTSTTSNYTGDNTSEVYFWGAQLEAGAFPTSYIKTTTASVTRNADVASMTSTNFSDWYNATEGTIFTQTTIYYNLLSGAFPRIFDINDGTSQERIIQNYASDLPGLRNIVVDGGVNVAVLDFSVGQSNGVTRNFANAYKVNDFAASINGGSVVTDTSGTLPTPNKINFGVDLSNLNALNGHIAKFYYWNTRKSNAFLQGVTS